MATGEPRYGVDPYLEWVNREGVPVVEDIGIDLFEVPIKPWDRFGCDGAAVHLRGRGDFSSMFLFEIVKGGSTAIQQHLFEKVIYVLEGHGSTQVELANGSKHLFEWGPRSLFAIPLNAKYRHFNGSGTDRALIVATTNCPTVMNLFNDESFVFDHPYDFSVRAGKDGYFTGDGDFHEIRQGNHMWETNFVPDLAEIELRAWGDRGAGGTNIMFVLADGVMHAHISEMPVGTYKKGHRHGPGFHVMCVTGHGYSLLWYDGEPDFTRVDWKHGVVFPPADQQFHQHFNTSTNPARYLATGIGGTRYPFTTANRRSLLGLKPGEKGAVSTSLKEGGDQIEYEDQHADIHRIWLEEMRKNGVDAKMEKFIPNP